MTDVAAGRRGAAAGGRDGATVFAAALAIALFALSPVTTRVLVGEMNPVMAGLLRTVGAAAVTLPLALLLRLPLPRGAREWRLLLLSSLLSFTAFPVLFCLGGGRTSATHAALIMAGAPLVTSLHANALERRLPSAGWWAGAAVACASEAALVLLRGPGSGEVTIAGDLLVLAACLASGVGYVVSARLTARIGSRAATLWGVNLASLVQAPAVIWLLPGTDWSAIGPAGWASLLHLAFGVTALALFAWFWALARGGIARVAVLQFAQPLGTLGFAAALLGERLTPPLLLAAGGILLGVALARRSG